MEMPFYQQRWFKIGGVVFGVILIYAMLHFRQPAETLAGWLVDILGAAMMFLLTLALASQYILPVRSQRERTKALERLYLYVSGGHGPIVFVRDGELVGSKEELKRRGAGVILLDGSSAVVLEKGRQFSRAEGPGIVFTSPAERIAATFDLRRQARTQNVAALTRDGIELKADVTVVFALDPTDQASPRDSEEERDIFGQAPVNPAYPFSAVSTFKAYYGSAVAEKDALVRWTDLPLIVASEIFRDHISRASLDELFLPNDPDSSPVALLQTRIGNETQTAHLLRERGIKVFSVSIGLLALPEAVTAQRIRSWAARWQKEAFTALANAEVESERIRERARAEAQAEMLEHFKGHLLQAFSGDPSTADKREIARKLVSALNRVASDPVTRMLLSGDTMKQISNLRHWVGLPETSNPPPETIAGQVTPSEDLSEVAAGAPKPQDDSGEKSPA